MNNKLPVTVLGGYLGAGKTTIVNHLLREAGGRRLAVLVNEFGALPIDESLIEAESDKLISIAGGCICCAFGENLAGALRDLMHLDPTPDHVLIESSGVAIPSAIAGTISLIRGLELNAILVVADAETARRDAADKYVGDTILRQLSDADLILVTKGDLVSKDEMDEVIDWLISVAGQANAIPASCGQVPLDIVFDPHATSRTALSRFMHTPAFESIVLKPNGAVDAQALARDLATGGFGLVRAKGIVRDESGVRMLVQIVGKRFEATPTEIAETGGLVCIGVTGQLDEERLIKRLEVAAGAAPSPAKLSGAGSV